MVIIASLFYKVNCDYASCEGRSGWRREGSGFAPLFSSFCVHGNPHVLEGKGVEVGEGR